MNNLNFIKEIQRKDCLEYKIFDEKYKVPLPPAKQKPFVQRKAADLLWIATFAIPWIIRRLRGKSSGDGRSPKYPTLQPWPK